MGLFTSQYKEDALKWRAQQKERDEKELARNYKMTVEIVLKDGDTHYAEYFRDGDRLDVSFLYPEFVVRSGEVRLKRLYAELKEQAGTCGMETVDGIFIPHSNIHHIRNAGIEEVI